MSLRDQIHQLSRAHLRTGPDGKAHMVPALLDELRAAVTPGRNSTGGGASGPPIPIDPDALDLLREIETEARRDYREITGEVWQAGLEGLLQGVAELDLTPAWDTYLAHVTIEWIGNINAMLWPVKPRRKLVGKVCPACGWATYGEERKTCLTLGCWDTDGAMKKIGDWDIECDGCDASWSGEQVAYLLKALDTGDTITSEAA